MNRINRRRVLSAAGAIGLSSAMIGLPRSSLASGFPTRLVKIVVPYPAGGTTDVLARMIAVRLQESWSQPVIVENKVGASGVVGNDYVAKAAPDGHTILLTITALVQSASLMKLPYDPYVDFKPVSQLCVSPNFLVVPGSFPAKSVDEFIAYVKSKPGKHSYGSFGNGSTSHIQGANFNTQAGLDMVHVPYKGSAPLLNDLLSGQVSCSFLDAGATSQHAAAGGIRVIAVAGTERMKVAPDAPTLGEIGYKNFEPKGWYAFFAPAGTSQAVAAKISDDIRAAIRTPEIASRLESMGQVAVGGTPSEMATVMRQDGAIWAKLVRELNIRAD